MKKRILFLFVAALLLTGCGSSDSESPDSAPSASGDTVTETNDSTGGDTDTTTAIIPRGSWGESGDLSARVDSSRTSSKVTYVDDSGSSKTKKAASGAKFVSVTATIKNDTKDGIDLTCSGLVVPKLMDSDGRRFTSNIDLYKIRGNPECNAMLDPGFKDRVTWVYRLPSDATPKALEFVDDTDGNATQEPAVLAVQ